MFNLDNEKNAESALANLTLFTVNKYRGETIDSSRKSGSELPIFPLKRKHRLTINLNSAWKRKKESALRSYVTYIWRATLPHGWTTGGLKEGVEGHVMQWRGRR